eukprot:scaffold651032_cov55-Prasinocladus_malaysianus.AAC.1
MNRTQCTGSFRRVQQTTCAKCQSLLAGVISFESFCLRCTGRVDRHGADPVFDVHPLGGMLEHGPLH